MKIVWLGGVILPEIAQKENFPITYTNGWLVGFQKEISKFKDVKLMYIFDSPRIVNGEVGTYIYRGIYSNKKSVERKNEEYSAQLLNILREFKPDVIHIWGSENLHTFSMINAAENCGLLNKVVLSIQGLVSIYEKHYEAYLPKYISNGLTVKDVLKGNINKQKKRFYEAGKLERESIKKINNVIGRTEWDKACSLEINPNITYYHNNEILRNEFYSGQWQFESCEKHSLFCSQGHYPIKGLHLMLNAMSIAKEFYPDIKLYIAGKDYFNIPSFQRNTYERYIIDLIKHNNLKNNIFFVGKLDAEQMKKQYLNCNIFVSPSSIENSPNSVGEAMLLGVPVISSRVGGVHNMLKDKEEGYLYPADEPYMLAYYIKEMFDDTEHAKEMAYNAKKHAQQIFDREKNINDLLYIYNEINK